jgi:hypothetical protein
MMTPLYFIPRNTSQSIKDLDRVLSISQIILDTKLFYRQFLFGYPKTLLQLGYMEGIMYIHKDGRVILVDRQRSPLALGS